MLRPLASQEPVATSGWDGVWALAQIPGLVEFLLAMLLFGGGAVAAWRVGALVRGSRRHKEIGHYLLGVEQALARDLVGARQRLEKVVAADPENHYARLLLGKVLGELGEPEQAHKHHHYLREAFLVDSPHNELLLAQCLLDAGLPDAAAAAAERAAQRLPGHAAALELVYRAHLQAGDLQAAAHAGQRLLARGGRGTSRTSLRSEVAATAAAAGLRECAAGKWATARELAAVAQRLDPKAEDLALLSARLEAERHGSMATARRLMAAPGALAVWSPNAGEQAVVRAASPAGAAAALPMATFAGLVPAQRYRCRRCTRSLSAPGATCPRCAAAASAEAVEPALSVPLPSALEVMDAIEANPAHVQRRVAAALDGDLAAARDVQALGARAVSELLLQASAVDVGSRAEAALGLLFALGPELLPEVFAARRQLAEARRWSGVGARLVDATSRLVQRFGRDAQRHLAPLFGSALADDRKILIDYFLGLADPAAFQVVLERFPPLEIVHRCNRVDAAVLRRFLQALPPGHFVVETLLAEPAFERAAEVLAAIPGAVDAAGLEALLLRRGPSAELVRVLLDALGDPALADPASRLLRRFDADALDLVLAAFCDSERSEPERQRLGEVLVAIGATAVPRLCEAFGAEPSGLDDALHAVLVAIGANAVAVLQEAYASRSLLERFLPVLTARHTNRRMQIVRALASIPGGAAAAALRTLAQEERDDNLRLMLEQVLRQRSAEGKRG